MNKSFNQSSIYRFGLPLCLGLGSLAFLAIGIWATILLLFTSKITTVLILVLLGGWFVIGCIITGAVLLWQLVRNPKLVNRNVHRLQWLLGLIAIIIAAISLPLSYFWADTGDAPGVVFIGLFLRQCRLLVGFWLVFGGGRWGEDLFFGFAGIFGCL